MLTNDFMTAVKVEDKTLSNNLREDMAHDLAGVTPQNKYPGLRWYHVTRVIRYRHEADDVGMEAILAVYEGM